MNAPEVFDQRDEDGVVVLLNPNPSAEQAEATPQSRRILPGSGHPHRGVRRVRDDGEYHHGNGADVPEYPMPRAAGCPFAPPPEVMALAEASPLSRVRIWDGSTPWLITGYEQCRELFSDSRVSVDDRVPGFPHWNAGHVGDGAQAPAIGLHRRWRRAHPIPANVVASRSPFSGWRDCDRPSSRSPTSTSTRCWPGPQPADIVSALALPVPSLVISQLLGVPYEDAEMFQHHANVGLARVCTW